MTPHERRKLDRIARSLEDSLAFVRDLLNDSADMQEKEVASNFDAAAELASLKQLDRSVAELRLSELKQHELGAIFVNAGGPLADKKKPKVWLVEQLLWRVFDFERGHEAIRNKGSS